MLLRFKARNVVTLDLDDFGFRVGTVLVGVSRDVVISSGVVDVLVGDESICTMELHVDVTPLVADCGLFVAVDSNLEDAGDGASPVVFVVTGHEDCDWVKVLPEFKQVEESLCASAGRLWSRSWCAVSVPRVHVSDWPFASSQVRIGEIGILSRDRRASNEKRFN